jgi:hypothetical protein
MFSSLLLVLGVGVFSMALRSFRNALLHKLGSIGILVTSFLAGHLLTGSVAAGIVCAASWLLLPWLEILTRVRRLRLPAEKDIRHRLAPSQDHFPALPDLTDEIEQAGFAHVEDAGWDWDEQRHFLRLFYREKDRVLAAICMVEQQELAYYYLNVSSRAQDGRIWTTWNYPFPYSLMLVPQVKINRLRADQTFMQLDASHRQFLVAQRVSTDQIKPLDPDSVHDEIQKDLRKQLTHNLNKGVLVADGKGHIRYSWRGFFYLWFQFLRDLVRL